LVEEPERRVHGDHKRGAVSPRFVDLVLKNRLRRRAEEPGCDRFHLVVRSMDGGIKDLSAFDESRGHARADHHDVGK
jgi:hypothetical protein